MKRVRDLSYFYSRGLGAFLLIMAVLVAFMYFFRAERAYSMVILPYKNETGTPDLDYVADGFGDSLSTKLAISGKLRLKSLPSKPQNSEPDHDPLTIGRESGVEFVLSGKITRQNDALMLRTNVLDVADGVVTREWNIPFQVSGMPELEEKVAQELYSGLKISESTIPSNNSRRHGAFTENGEASRQYLIGRYYWKKRDRDNIKLAIAAFEHAIELDPGYSRPYSGLSDCYVLLSLVSYGSMPASDAMTKARAAARQALEIDPYDAPAHTSLGIVYTRYYWKWAEAENEFRLSIQTDADYAAAHYWYSDLLANLGRSEESVAEARKAKELDPFSPLANYNLARTLYYARQYDKALEVLNDPSGPGLSDKKIRYMLGLVYLQKGMYRDAQNVFENIMTENRMLGAAALGYTYAKLGRREDALKLVGELRKTSADAYVPPQEIAIIYIGLQEKDNALRYLTDSFKERNAAIVALKVEPLFDPLRNDTRFITLLNEMDLR
jgi:tetratricopeptide (TPR) repeat protein/TolB-like protein